MQCKTIDEVIHVLDEIITGCKQRQDPLGYFAVLYRKVTKRVQQGILHHEFEDNARMEKLDVLFANRYFAAFDAYRKGEACSACWKTAFDAGREKNNVILQHTLLGINAHINLDLGIAAFDTMNGQDIHHIQTDFFTINRILAEMTDEVKTKLSRVSPVFRWLVPLAGHRDEMLVKFSINTAREGAWEFALQLSGTNRDPKLIARRDQVIATLGNAIRNPGTLLRWALKPVRLAEWRSVAANLAILEQ